MPKPATLNHLDPGRNICPHCGAAINFDPSTMRRVHRYDWRDVLRPRGEMAEESLSLEIFNQMVAVYETWTDSAYGDLPDLPELRGQIIHNARDAVEEAIEAFAKRFGNSEERTNLPEE
jgi:hypothetical protein